MLEILAGVTAYPAFADHNDSNALSGAIGWIQVVLTGSLATSIAILAVAALGFTLLRGRADVSGSIRIIAGCFILFGAPIIATGLLHLIRSDSSVIVIPPAPPALDSTPMPVPQANPDPYAGASVPM